MLAPLQLELVPQGEFGVADADETGLTFVENAIIKARAAARQARLPTIADDSGLEVDALHGAPGIYSARYAGSAARDDDNLRKLLQELTGVPENERSARFRCLMVYLRHERDAAPIISQGTWEGRILFQARGTNGFGYDPVFFVPSHRCSAAELLPEIKNQLSHRGQALRKLVTELSAARK